MIYTSGQHLGVKTLFLLGWGVEVVLLAFLSGPLSVLFGLPKDYQIVPLILLGIPVTVIHIRLMDKYADLIAAYRYVNKDLDTPINWQEAKQLSFLFSGDADDQWYPLIQVKTLPKESRKQYLFDFATRLRRN